MKGMSNDDVKIGHRIKARRQVVGLSQSALGKAMGVTFQQVQKYEKGTNRVSAGNLIKIARALNTDPHALLGMNGAPTGDDLFDVLSDHAVSQIVRALRPISHQQRRIIADVVMSMVRMGG